MKGNVPVKDGGERRVHIGQSNASDGDSKREVIQLEKEEEVSVRGVNDWPHGW